LFPAARFACLCRCKSQCEHGNENEYRSEVHLGAPSTTPSKRISKSQAAGSEDTGHLASSGCSEEIEPEPGTRHRTGGVAPDASALNRSPHRAPHTDGIARRWPEGCYLHHFARTSSYLAWFEYLKESSVRRCGVGQTASLE
jgi:hypothetical protein